MSIEYDIEVMIVDQIRTKYLGRHLTLSPVKRWWGSPWTIHEPTVEGGTHVVIDCGFSFDTHYCPDRDSYDISPGVRTYTCYLIVRDISSKTLTTIYYDLGDL